jgi:two-component system, OmpR family, sensor histidine kinase KdpD
MPLSPLEPKTQLAEGTPTPAPFLFEFIQEKPLRGWYLLANLVKVLIIIGLTTLVCFLATRWLDLKPEACCLLYLGVTVLFGVILPPPAPFFLAIFSLISWNFFFTEPAFSLRIDTADELILHVLFLLIAIVMNRLTAGLRQRERESRQNFAKAELLRECQTALASDNTPKFLNLISTAVGGNAELLSASVHAPVKTDDEILTALSRGTENLGYLKIKFTNPLHPTPKGEALLEELSHLASAHLERQRFVLAAEKAQKAAVSERLGRALLDNVTHEIKTPVSIMLASIHRLRSHSEPRHAEDIINISEAANRLVRITEELTLLSSVQVQMLRPRTEHCNAGELVEEILANAIQSKIKQRVKVEIQAPLACVRTDPQFFSIILTNFLSNAARHSAATSPILLQVKEVNGQVVFAVTDHGQGVAETDLPHIFERFYRGDNPGSLGLGLSICREIAGILEAELTVNNRPPLGAEFAIHLPAATPYFAKEESLS